MTDNIQGNVPNHSTPATNGEAAPARVKSRRGFASMDPQRQREIAREGGRASHASGNAHEFTPEEARAAGRKSHQGQPGRGRSRDDVASETGQGNAAGTVHNPT